MMVCCIELKLNVFCPAEFLKEQWLLEDWHMPLKWLVFAADIWHLKWNLKVRNYDKYKKTANVHRELEPSSIICFPFSWANDWISVHRKKKHEI